ncbi:MAG: hypothetical protein ACO3E1_05750 [Flavobacteriales bacterium]
MNPELIDFIIKRSHFKTEQIKPELRLAKDIGFYGLDAISFFEDFFIVFKIKNTEDFNADLHIDGGPDFAPQPMKWIKNLIIKKRRKYLKPDVTIGHLQKVIEKGRWFNEI